MEAASEDNDIEEYEERGYGIQEGADEIIRSMTSVYQRNGNWSSELVLSELSTEALLRHLAEQLQGTGNDYYGTRRNAGQSTVRGVIRI